MTELQDTGGAEWGGDAKQINRVIIGDGDEGSCITHYTHRAV